MSDLMMAIGGQTAGFIAEQWMRVSSKLSGDCLRSLLPMKVSNNGVKEIQYPRTTSFMV